MQSMTVDFKSNLGKQPWNIVYLTLIYDET